MAEDWFRKKTWAKSDEEDFFVRLKRTRQYNRAQYLRIQASHLADTGNPENLTAALELLDLLFANYPERTEMASAFEQKANCLLALGNLSKSIAYFKESIDFQRNFPNVRTQAPINLGLTVVENELVSEYDEVIRILNEFGDDLITFPIDEYHVYAIRAIIESQKGSPLDAKHFAEKAIDASRKTHSGFRYHASLGLVRNVKTELHRKLKAIIGEP